MIDSDVNPIETAQHKVEDIPEPAPTAPCALCGRKFLAERLEKHQKICNKTKESQKKRKAFDSHKQRADLEKVNGFPVTPPSRQTTAKVADKPPNNKTSNWRAKHEEFIRTVRQARGEKVDEPVAQSEGGGPRVPVGYVMCTFCGRNFSDKAADRHIEWCREQKARIPRSANNNRALERMKARTQYKPTPNKSSPKTETPPKPGFGGSRSQPPTPPNSRRTVTQQTRKPSPPNSLPIGQSNGYKSKASPKTTTPTTAVVRSVRTTPSPPSKSKFDKHRINSLSRPKNSSPDSMDQLMTQKEPIMKFKEKFPNHTNHTNHTNFVRNEQLKELLKKTEAYNGPPRTVPGVRTGGMSPVKSDNHAYSSPKNGHYNNHNISEEEELAKLKTRIEELYLNGSTKYKPNSLQNNNQINANNKLNNNHVTNGKVLNGQVTNGKIIAKVNHYEINSENSTTRGSTGGSESSSSIHTPPRDGSASDGQTTNGSGLPKFCHQCGTKYPTTIAKYCYECGSRRLGTVGPFLTNLD